MSRSDAEGDRTGGRPAASGAEWFALAERTSVLGIRILLAVRRIFGDRLFGLILPVVLSVYWVTSPRLRAVTADYQRRADAAHPFLEREFGCARPGFASGIAQLKRFGLAILEKFAALSGEGDPAKLEVIGDAMFDADPPDAGAVVLTSHTGCQELLSQASRTRSAHTIVILQHTGHARRFNELLERAGARPPKVKIFEIGATLSPALVMELADLTARGAYVVLAGDRVPMGSGAAEAVPFMGAPARFPTGGALLALLLGVPLRMMVCTRPDIRARRYRVVFRELSPARRIGRRERPAHLRAMAAAYAAALEAELAASPLDWANYYDFWEALPAARNAEEDP